MIFVHPRRRQLRWLVFQEKGNDKETLHNECMIILIAKLICQRIYLSIIFAEFVLSFVVDVNYIPLFGSVHF